MVFDPLISPQTAKAALAFINKTLGERPVSAVVYSHSHVDHYGGAAGLFNSPDEVKKERGSDHRPRRVHRACGLGKRHRRQRHGPPCRLHVWRPAAAQCPGRREWRPGADHLHRRSLPAAANPLHHQDRGRGYPGRRTDGLPDDPGHRSAGRDEHLVPGQQGTLDGREHHQHHAQHPHPARRPGARCPQVVQLPQRDHRDLGRPGPGQVPEPPLAALGQCQHRRLLQEAAGSLQVHPRSVGTPDEHGLHG
ncbi:MBL fold metallo-hydrolase [Aeromonas enteropelogenes]|uniref:MBL fold metallo-hydrolase n=1 Tax=Aeromonas enteropelogenes TaxID=29489 RepID=UPI003B9E9672